MRAAFLADAIRVGGEGRPFLFAVMQILPHFHAKELVPPNTWQMYESGAVDPQWFLQPRLLELLHAMRKRWGPLQVNTWHRGGSHTERGYRLPRTDTGAEYSQHKLGAAVDFVPVRDSLTVGDVRADIMDNESHWYRCGLRAIEDGEIATTWVHADVRATTLDDEIKVVRP